MTIPRNIHKRLPGKWPLLLVISAACLLLLANCGKESCLGKKHYQHYPDVVKSYIDPFKDGSWWTYRCSKTNVTDSVYITDYIFSTSAKNGDCEYQDERHFTLHSDSMIYHYGNTSGQFKCSGMGNDNYAYLAFDFGIDLIYENGEFKNSIKSDSIKIGTVYFKDILKYTAFSGKPYPVTDTSEFYFSKQVGLVQYINPFKDTFNLIQYDIK